MVLVLPRSPRAMRGRPGLLNPVPNGAYGSSTVAQARQTPDALPGLTQPGPPGAAQLAVRVPNTVQSRCWLSVVLLSIAMFTLTTWPREVSKIA